MAENNLPNVAIITGGSEGIGFGCAQQLQTKGYLVVLVGRSQSKLDLAKSCLPAAVTVSADVSLPADVERVFFESKNLGRVAVVVHAAGGFLSKPLIDMTFEDYQRIRSSLDMTFLVNRAALQSMAVDGGVVINISSRAGLREEVLPASAGYAAVKAGMINLAAAADQEVTGVRVITLCPGAVETTMGNAAAQERGLQLDKKSTLTIEETAEAVTWLVGESLSNPNMPRLWRIIKHHDTVAFDMVTNQGW